MLQSSFLQIHLIYYKSEVTLCCSDTYHA